METVYIIAGAAAVVVIAAWLVRRWSTAGLSMAEQKKIAGKTYVIVGASSGFGRGVALKLGRYHANVVLAARRTELLEEIAGEIRKSGGTALPVTMDISDHVDVRRLADAALAQYGRIDVWINNTGVGALGPFWDIPLSEHSRVIDVNLKGVIYGCYAAMKIFRAQHYGTLINTGSIDSEVPIAYQSSYAASKAAVRSLGETLQQELRLDKETRIKISTIMPWAVDTPWWRHAANHSGGTPRMAAMDDPEKVVNAIIFASLYPKREVPVGWKACASYVSHHLFPHLTERFASNMEHHYQVDTAPPAEETSGTLFRPMQSGRGVEDGVRKRIKEENRQRRAEMKEVEK